MVEDRHRNIFYYYKGTSREEEQREGEQIENNTTKALINVLEHGDREVLKSFLEELGIKEASSYYKNAQFALQTQDISKIQGKKILLVISPLKLSELPEKPKKGDSIPDAWIYSDAFTVLIENKTVDIQDIDQLARHWHKLKCSRENIKSLTWSEIYQFIENLLKNKSKDEKTEFLLRQLKEYLEAINMAPFRGFEKEDFVLWSEDEKKVEELKNKFKKLAEELKEPMKKKGLKYFEGKSNLPEKNVGWHAFYDTKSDDKPPDCAHFSVFHSPGEGLTVKLHLKLNDTTHGENFRKKLNDEKNQKLFYKLLENLREYGENRNGKYEIIIQENETPEGCLPNQTEPDPGCQYTLYSTYIDTRGEKGKGKRKDRTEERLKKIREMIEDIDLNGELKNKPMWFSVYFTFEPEIAEKLRVDITKEIENIFTEDLWELYNFIVK